MTGRCIKKKEIHIRITFSAYLDKLIAKLQSESLAAKRVSNHKMFSIQLCSFELIKEDGIAVDGNIVQYTGTFYYPI